MSEPAWTVMRLLEWTTGFFRKHGSASPRLDAEILLAHARGCQRIELYTAFGDEPDEEQRVAFRELVRRRGEGAPVAQLVGFKEFYSIPLRVDEHVLIPRPETEHLVVEAIDRLKEMTSSGTVAGRDCRVLDIGTGSGAIAIAIAKNFAKSKLMAVDISLPALEIARWNVEKQKLDERIDLMQSDLFESLAQDDRFDLICSNPPYVSQSEYDALSPTVRQYEPKSALLAGEMGTEVIAKLIDQSPAYLQPHGSLIIELSPMIAEAVRDQVRQRDAWAEPKIIRDLEHNARILSVRRK